MDLYDQFCESADLLQDMVADAYNIPRPWLKIELRIKISVYVTRTEVLLWSKYCIRP